MSGSIGNMYATLLVLIGSQLCFSVADVLGRHNMQKLGFQWETFASAWFLVYALLRVVATAGQLYVFSHLQLGRTMALFATANLILANTLGYLLLGEVMPLLAYGGIMLAIISFFVVAYAA